LDCFAGLRANLLSQPLVRQKRQLNFADLGLVSFQMSFASLTVSI
jgi:hypothetical protein